MAVSKSRGRTRTSEYERKQIKEFNRLITEHSVNAVEEIYKLATKSTDANVRLKANIFIIEKLVGKGYTVYEPYKTEQENGITINIVTKAGKEIDCKNIDKMCEEAEECTVTEDTYNPEWDIDACYEDNTSWGEDIYTP